MMLKNKNTNVILTLAIALITIIWLVIIPQSKALGALAEEIKKEKEELEEMQSSTKKIQNLRKQLEFYRSAAVKLKSIFIYPNNEIDLITSLEKIALKNNMEQTIQLSEPELVNMEEKNLETSNLNLNLKGDFEDLLNYLADMESLDFYINVKMVHLANNISSSGTSLPMRHNTIIESVERELNINIEAQVYWQ